MANTFLELSTTAASNTEVDGISIQGGAPVSNFDGALRSSLAILRAGLDGKVVQSSKSANYTAVADDNNGIMRFSAAATLSLTAAATLGANWHLTVVANGGAVTIDPNSSETIDGATTLVVPDGGTVFIWCDGSNFRTSGISVVADRAQSLTAAQKGQARANIGADVLGDFRNKIINGNAELVQRGTVFNIAAGQVAYTADRIRIFNNTNQTLNVQCPVTMSFAGSGKHPGLRLAFTTAPTSGNVFITQRIEGADTLANSKATMSFAHAAGEVVTASCYLSQNFGSGGSASVGIPAQNVALRSDGGIGIAKLVFDIPSTEGKIFGANDYLEWVVSIPVRTTNPVTITRMSLVEGDATAEDDPFSPRHPQQEEALCMRYYEKLQTDVYGAFASSANFNSVNWPFKVRKRATPVMSWSLAGANPLSFGVDGARAINTANSGPGILAGTSADAEL